MSDFLSVAAAADLDILEAAGEPAIYRQAGTGDPLEILAFVDRGTADATSIGATVRLSARVVRFRMADVATPRDGDTLELAAETLTLKGAPRRDPGGLMWTMDGQA